jgi:hypothetical protein
LRISSAIPVLERPAGSGCRHAADHRIDRAEGVSERSAPAATVGA